MEPAPRLATPNLGGPFTMDVANQEKVATASSAGEYATPKRPLRSISRQYKQIRLLSTLAQKSTHIALNAPPRLRRVRAFSPLVDSVSRFSPTVSVEVSKEDWLEGAIAKTKAIMADMENVEKFARRLSRYSASSLDTCSDCDSFSSVGSGAPLSPSTLHRKSAFEDLRSQYIASDSGSDSDKWKRLSASTNSAVSATSSFWSSTSENSSATCNSKDTVVWQDVFCLCGRSHHPAHGAMVNCSVCDKSCHLRCVGMEHLAGTDYDEAAFACPSCEKAAFRKIIQEED